MRKDVITISNSINSIMLRHSGVSLSRSVHSVPNSRSLLPLICARSLSTQKRPNSTLSAAETLTGVIERPHQASNNNMPQSTSPPPPLSTLPTPHLLRTILICTVTTSPFLSGFLTRTLLNHTKFLTSNPISKFILHHTFYDHYCAGATHSQIQGTLARLKTWGFKGIILMYAKEVEVTDSKSVKDTMEADIEAWKQGTLKTIEYSEPGSHIAVKYSGAGAGCVMDMEQGKPPCPQLRSALQKICEFAVTRNIKLLFDAEQDRYQTAMDNYTLDLMRAFNRPEQAPIVYNTYQMYRRCSPELLRSHVGMARRESFSFGAKVVRGAYLHSDPRDTLWTTKEETDKAYDEGIEYLIASDATTATSAGVEKVGADEVRIGVIVATHNQQSVDNAVRLLKSGGTGAGRDVVFAQLAGMADEVSMSVVNGAAASAGADGENQINVVKYIPWGTMEECMKYLLRRADENKDSLARTVDTRKAAWKELWRRIMGGS